MQAISFSDLRTVPFVDDNQRIHGKDMAISGNVERHACVVPGKGIGIHRDGEDLRKCQRWRAVVAYGDFQFDDTACRQADEPTVRQFELIVRSGKPSIRTPDRSVAPPGWREVPRCESPCRRARSTSPVPDS